MPWKIECERQQRWRFIQEWMRRKMPLVELCRRCRISRKTAYKWIARFKAEGQRGLGNRRRAAGRVHNRPAASWLARVRRWRGWHPRWGARKLHWALRRRFGPPRVPSPAAISRWLKAWELSRKRTRPRHRGPVVERPCLTIARRPNEVWSVDFKGWFRTTDGAKIEPLTVRDMASRYIVAVELMRAESIRETRQAFTRIFRACGLPEVIRVDNGAPFGSTGALGLTQLSAWWVKLGIRVEFIAPGRPDQNGAHEQMHRVYKAETATPPAPSLRAQQRRTNQWRDIYNHERPHEALAMHCPAQFYRKSRRKLPARLPPWTYPPGWVTRLVKGKGMICLQGQGRYVGEAFERERVGLKRTARGWAVYFGSLFIGELKANELTGIHAVWFRKGPRRPGVRKPQQRQAPRCSNVG
jgi:putative transposase